MRYFRRTALAFALFALPIMAVPPQAQTLECKNWPSAEFFEAATEGDVRQRVDAEGADPNLLDEEKWTPLRWAATGNENSDVIEELINAAGDPNLEDLYGRTTLHIAVGQDNRPAIDALVAGIYIYLFIRT